MKKKVVSREVAEGIAAARQRVNAAVEATEKKTLPLEDVVLPEIEALQKAMTLARCEQIVNSAYFNKSVSPIAVYPSCKKEGGMLLGFALHVGRIERSACLDVVAQHVTPDVLSKIREAVITGRGPVNVAMQFRVEWRPDSGKWEPASSLALAR